MLYAIKVLNPGSVPHLGDEEYVKSCFGDTSRLEVARVLVRESCADYYIEKLNAQHYDRVQSGWYEGVYDAPLYQIVEVEIKEVSDAEQKQSGQLPESMENCTILFKQCPKGHGWLTATNWIQHDCQVCEILNLRAELDESTRNMS